MASGVPSAARVRAICSEMAWFSRENTCMGWPGRLVRNLVLRSEALDVVDLRAALNEALLGAGNLAGVHVAEVRDKVCAHVF